MMHLFNPACADHTLTDIGGKGLNLLRLKTICNVPQWFAVPESCFSELLISSGVDQRIARILKGINADNIDGRSAEIRGLIVSLSLPEVLTSEIEELLQKLAGADGYVAVRSSAGAEDGRRYSFAGIHESFLNVKGREAVCTHIRKVWASGYSAAALRYRRQNKLPLHPVPMAVVVQRMICAKSSGVIFTADPVSQSPLKMVISSLYGLGAGLVSAGLEADHCSFDKRSRQLSTIVADKSRQIVLNKAVGYGVYEDAVDQQLRCVAALSAEELKQVAVTALNIENHFGRPQDIEFCFDGTGQLCILQSRDITNIREYGPAAGYHQVWDNSLIIDCYSGVTSPMTFSFIRSAYAEGYRILSAVMGLSGRRIAANEELYGNMLGFFQGRVYSSLPGWYRLVKQFPVYNYGKPLIDSVTGLTGKEEFVGEIPERSSFLRRALVEFPRMVLSVCRLSAYAATLGLRVALFKRRFERFMGRWSAADFGRMQPHELMQVYQEVEAQVLRKWKTPVINDLYVMLLDRLLKKYCRNWCGDDDGSLQNKLICGEGGLASSGPTRMLMQMALKIKGIDGLKYLFQTYTPEELAAVVPVHPECREIAGAIRRYLQLYGFRCANELKLEEPSLHETPEFIYQMLQNYIGMSDCRLDVNAMMVRERVIRVEAEQRVFKKLSGVQRIRFRLVLSQLRKGVGSREKLRYARTRICGMIRQLLNAAGEIMAREGVLDHDQEIYYLTLDEVWDYIKGTAVTADLRSLVEVRQSEYDRYCHMTGEVADIFSTYGMAYNRNTFKAQEISVAGAESNGGMHGISCSPGRVKGTARVVHSPRDDMRLNRQILVAARSDPGWLLLYPAISAILIEHGSILSHAAIVAREMAIPAIIGIPGLLAAVSDGSQLIVDATAGTVNLA